MPLQNVLSPRQLASVDKVKTPRNRKAERIAPAVLDNVVAPADKLVHEALRTEIMDVVADSVICLPSLPGESKTSDRQWRIPGGVLAAEKVFRGLSKHFTSQHKRQWVCCTQDGNVSVHSNCKAGLCHALERGFAKDTYVVRPVSEVAGG